MLLLFISFRDEEELLSGFPQMYLSKGVQKARCPKCCKCNQNKVYNKPYNNLVDQDSSKFNEALTDNKDSHSKIENDRTPQKA